MEKIKNFDEYVLAFGKWLKDVKKQKENTISSRISNIKVVGESYDLLKEYSLNKCERIFEELAFTKNDLFPKTDIIINGDYYNGLATYRAVLRLFVEFLGSISYTPIMPKIKSGAKFIGSFDEFKRFVGPFSKNEVNRFCKKDREKHKKICEWCGKFAVLQSAHIVERPIIVKQILDNFYKIGPDLYEVYLEDFFTKFEEAHTPIEKHIFFLCSECHTKLDKKKTITINDIINKRKGE